MKKVHVRFDWSDAADDNYRNNLPATRRSSQQTQTQDNAPLPTTLRDANNNNFNDNADIPTTKTTSRRQR